MNTDDSFAAGEYDQSPFQWLQDRATAATWAATSRPRMLDEIEEKAAELHVSAARDSESPAVRDLWREYDEI